MFLRYDVIFAGRVQGVFFRATAEQLARDYSVTGYVRNRSDGTVHCVAEGEQQELDRFGLDRIDLRDESGFRCVNLAEDAAPFAVLLLHRARGHEPVDEHGLVLSEAMGAVRVRLRG